MEDIKYNGMIIIIDGKVSSVSVKTPDGVPMQEISQIIAAKNMMDNFLLDYEKDYKRS